jgi:hypothetical protein
MGKIEDDIKAVNDKRRAAIASNFKKPEIKKAEESNEKDNFKKGIKK